MPHISFSELKNWNFCPFYHKLVHIDKLKGFEGNEYTAFGSAIHKACELAVTDRNADLREEFLKSFITEIKEVGCENKSLLKDMKVQGEELLPHILPSLEDYFDDCEVLSVEERLYEPVKEYVETEVNFKGFIDLVLKTKDGKIHIIDWKTCSWGWDAKKKSDPMVTYQLTFYKHYYAKKHNIDPDNIETYFALLKRTAKKNKVEIFRVTSGSKRTQNALDLLIRALKNINTGMCVKNKLSCKGRYGYCDFYKTEHCP
jgi:ATP-dependent exoDNAse (exonuclease V) beta subunit|tara:strand:- start:17 stop:790 length:774 start_codon:yes stop_codon:yes gene_type:complete